MEIKNATELLAGAVCGRKPVDEHLEHLGVRQVKVVESWSVDQSKLPAPNVSLVASDALGSCTSLANDLHHRILLTSAQREAYLEAGISCHKLDKGSLAGSGNTHDGKNI